MHSVKSALANATERLNNSSLSPALDGEVLLGFVIGKDSAWIYAHGDDRLLEGEIKGFETIIARRAMGVPVAHLTGVKEFYGRTFHVTEDVLIPRPATEMLIDAALNMVSPTFILPLNEREEIKKWGCIVDVGTGSGCIAITIACEVPDVPIIATDISPAALAVAQKNAAAHGVAKRIRFIEGDLFRLCHSGVSPKGEAIESSPSAYWILSAYGLQDDRKKILVLANLPYLPTNTITGDLLHEPRLALDGGSDGGELYRRLDQQLETFAAQSNTAITLISERLAYSKDTSVPSFIISTHTFPGANEISSPTSV